MASISHTTLLLFLVFLVNSSEIRGDEPTHLHFYFHEIYSGPNATLVNVISTGKTYSSFGSIGVVDDMFKEGPDPSSKLIGRVQGLATASSMEDGALLAMINFVFTDGQYNGSTLAVFGRYLPGTEMERAIVGGTGQFRRSSGYTLIKPVPSEAGLLVLEYDAYIWH